MPDPSPAEIASIRIPFGTLFDQLGGDWEREKPILAHYTSIEVAERIFSTGTIWFSNPLYMNDHEELKWGIREIGRIVQEDPSGKLLAACGSEVRRNRLQSAFDHYVRHYEQEFVLKIFASCWTQHSPDETDGVLSMWRGYGGNGRGLAIEINTAKFKPIQTSPVLLLKVSYGDSRRRRDEIEKLFAEWCGIIANTNIAEELLYLASYELFQLSLLYALSSKHAGFSEENEWRFVYMPDRDTDKALEPYIQYALVRGRAEPKLKLELKPISGVLDEGFSLAGVVHGAILGPGQNDALSVSGFRFLLQRINRGDFVSLLKVSGIPFRA